MKLAEALSLRAELKSKINLLKDRIKESAKIQEGDEPVDDVGELHKELDDCLNQFENLIYRINMTNVQAAVDGESLTRLIARRDVLSKRVSIMSDVVNDVASNDTRYGKNEIRYVRTVDVKELHKEVDKYSRQLRELDLKIQGLNWTVELVE
ncbi:MAG: DIP1984 family protein [Prevotellaceae bacterium]|nr:DIP1984 family protein [Prevotella sp.]MDD7257726.1 DIP1984 family protein [Prevotellaceae bacterium]MDY6130348.1 DIP1984 family protein [Prevotella sp.]